MENSTLAPNKYAAAATVGIWKENATLRLLIGMCPTLAVTIGLLPGLTMGMCVIFVLVCSNIVVSLLRNQLRPHLRIIMFTLSIATFVTICDLYLKAFAPEMSTVLGPYVALIIVNCLIIFRAEACASKSGVVISILDALGSGLGFTLGLVLLGCIREILATGGINVGFAQYTFFSKTYAWAAMQMPVGAFVSLGVVIAIVNLYTRRK